MVKHIEKYNRCNKHACKEIYLEKKVGISFFPGEIGEDNF